MYPKPLDDNIGPSVRVDKGLQEKDLVNTLNIKYCLESEVQQNRQAYLIFKAIFA